MAKIKERACKICKTIHEEEKCPKCGSKEYTENYKVTAKFSNGETIYTKKLNKGDGLK